MLRCYIITITLTYATLLSYAQTDIGDPVKRAVEYTASISEDKVDVEELSSIFEDLLKNPICINDSIHSKLDKIPLLSDFLIQSIKDYIKEFGEFKSTTELQFVPGFDLELVSIISPFVTTTSSEKTHLTLKNLIPTKQSAMARSTYTFQKAKGYKDTTDNQFLGNRLHYAAAYNLTMGKNIFINIHSEKDAGEKAPLKQLYFDNFSASITAISPIKHVAKIIIGDYRINLGQGLVAWAGFSMNKSGDPSTIRKRSSITAYKSFDETSFYRGIATEVDMKPFTITLAASNRLLDGRISTSDSSKFTTYTTGLHRTLNEINSRATVNQQLLAGKISYSNRQNSIALNFVSKKMNKKGVQDLEQAFSLDFYKQWKKYSLFGEFASDNNLNLASLISTASKISSKATISASYRNYSRQYKISGNNAFGENSNATNEEGFYIGLKIIPKFNYAITAYADMFKFPYPKYRVSKSSNGSEVGIAIKGFLSKQIEGRLRYRYKTIEQDKKQNPPTFSQTETIQTNKGDLYLKFIPSKNTEITIGSSVSKYTSESHSSQWGYLLYTDIQHSFPSTRLQVYARFTTFNADSWDVAQYNYENDLPGMYASTSFNNKGNRAYLMFKIKTRKRLNFWTKISQTFYAPPISSIGEGTDMIEGSKKTEIKLQATLDF